MRASQREAPFFFAGKHDNVLGVCVSVCARVRACVCRGGGGGTESMCALPGCMIAGLSRWCVETALRSPSPR